MPSITIVATETSRLPGAKVGGMADVVGSLSMVLAARGWQVTFIAPNYGRLDSHPGFSPDGNLTTHFRGRQVTARVFRRQVDGVRELLVEHDLITGSQPGRIYYDDAADQPFATDGNRFALFSALVGEWLLDHPEANTLHLHDWHTAPLLLLRAFHPHFTRLRDIHTIFTIHNLAIQGIRPLRDDASSLFEWFPDLIVDDRVVDPRWPDCVNLMRAGIRLADRVNTVSPTYAAEILLSDAPERGFHGGEGLEADLGLVAGEAGLAGILNGCDYPRVMPGKRRSLATLVSLARAEIVRLAAEQPTAKSAHLVALERIQSLPSTARRTLITSVGRISRQKIGLLAAARQGRPLLHHLLETMHDGLMIMLGSGDSDLEQMLTRTMTEFDNFLFISGFSSSLANDLYRSGKLFLMPSSFEPCGISQMFAMRGGQPCLVHAVGGLRDTVIDGRNGWSFTGEGIEQQCEALLTKFEHAYGVTKQGGESYRQIAKGALESRFTWDASASAYESLYQHDIARS